MEDDTGDVILDSRGGEEHVSVSASVLGVVLEFDWVEFFVDGAWGLIGGEDAFSGGADFLGGLDQLLGVVDFVHLT